MITSFIHFTGQANEAIAFYETVFEVNDKQVMFYKDMPENMKSHFSRDTDHWVMHAEMTINGTPVWMGDTTQRVKPGDMVMLAMTFASPEDVRKIFEKLEKDGEALMELVPTFFSPLYGVVKDKFEVIWHLMCR